jgi:AbrB family looped-hinge helix DNA binding protein
VTTSISSKGQIVLPAELRKKDRIRAGQKFTVERVEAGEYRLVRQKQKKTKGLVAWLLSCPVKGYLEPIKSESTRTL